MPGWTLCVDIPIGPGLGASPDLIGEGCPLVNLQQIKREVLGPESQGFVQSSGSPMQIAVRWTVSSAWTNG